MVNTESKIIRIVFTIDRSYIAPLRAAITSLLVNNSAHQFIIYLISFSESDKFKPLTKSLASKFTNVSFELIKANEKLVKGFKISGHGSSTNYLRIFLPELLAEADEVLYLDSDIIVVSDIAELLNVDISNMAAAAVPYVDAERSKTLNIPQEEYFNSGVIKINLKHWRENGITSQLVDFLKNNDSKIKYWDQDALSAVLAGRYLKLQSKWNFIDSTATDENLRQHEINIIHYAGIHKPWNPHCVHSLKSEYFKYQDLSTKYPRIKQFVRPVLNLFKKMV
jgi:lipopolysaccharide biosynthesis glycosyltransferase